MHHSSSMLRLGFFTLAMLAALGCGENTTDPSLPRAGSGGGAAGMTSVAGAGAGGGSSGTGAGVGAGATSIDSGLPDAGSADAGPLFDAGSDVARNHVIAGSICERLSTIQCAAEAFCCDAPGRTIEECKTEMKSGCSTMLYLDDIAGEAVAGFDEPGSEAIFAHFEEMASRCDPEISAWGASVDGLRGILKGTRAAGADCAPEGVDPQNKIKAGAALASCTSLASSACLPLQASLITLSWTCAPLSAVGGDCFSDTNCQAGLYCNNPDLMLGAKCAMRKAAGTACVNPNECASLFCKSDVCVESSVQAAYCLMN